MQNRCLPLRTSWLPRCLLLSLLTIPCLEISPETHNHPVHADLVLAIGGQPTASLATTELLSLGADASWTANAPLVNGRSYFQAVQLVDGRILIAGGYATSAHSSHVTLASHLAVAQSVALPRTPEELGTHNR